MPVISRNSPFFHSILKTTSKLILFLNEAACSLFENIKNPSDFFFSYLYEASEMFLLLFEHYVMELLVSRSMFIYGNNFDSQ